MLRLTGFIPLPPPNEVTYAKRRLPDRLYISRTFELDMRNSQDHGHHARYVTKVFDEPAEREAIDPLLDFERTEHVVYTTPGGRKQIKLQITRQAGRVREILIQKVPTDSAATQMETILTLDRESSMRLIETVRALDYIPVEGGEETSRLDDQMIRDIFSDPEALQGIYRRAPDRFREFLARDPTETDVIALAHRQEVVEGFRQLLTEPDF